MQSDCRLSPNWWAGCNPAKKGPIKHLGYNKGECVE